ncbi:ATP-binding protein [Actinomadura fibrosa]|uniref:ATP-binding protein n=1 Tax=Actinomadura fibrosa TaxID=111802 RepID=A0ABW2XCL3_9ACTN
MLQSPAARDVVVDDAVTIVSELATNAFVHGVPGRPPDGPGPELVMYVRRARTEIVTQVFDSGPWKGRLPRTCVRSDLATESGRGLQLVDALTAEHGGSWGVHRSRSRLATVPEVAYFVQPVPEGGRSGQVDLDSGGRALGAALRARGLGPLHGCEGWDMAVLSVRAAITVWVRSSTISLITPLTGTVRYPLVDVADVVEGIVRCNEDLDAC